MSGFQPVTSRSTTKLQDRTNAAMDSLLDPKVPIQQTLHSTIDIRAYPADLRKGLLAGPVVTIVRNKIPIAQVPKRAFMATSEFGHKAILENPAAKEIALPSSAARLDAKALSTVFGWLSPKCIGQNVRPISQGQNTVEACKILHVATVLGMRMYTAHICAYFHAYINDQAVLLGYQELTALLAAIDSKDPLFKHLAKDLSHRRHAKMIPDPEDFAKYLKTQPALASAMDAIDEKHNKERKAKAQEKRAAYKAAAHVQYQEERRANAEKRRQERFMVQLQEARGGRAGGYGMGV